MWHPRLMVVDDDIDVAALICHVARGCGFQTEMADGIRAFEICASFEPDVIVLDIFMPEIDGFEVLRYLGQTHKSTSVVIISGKGVAFRDMAARMCEQHGINMLANLAKPFTIQQLNAALMAVRRQQIPPSNGVENWVRRFAQNR